MKQNISTANTIYPTVIEEGESEEVNQDFTDILFRVDKTKDFKGEVFALFPHEVCHYSGNVTSYQHVGQHSAADYLHCINTSRPALPFEYADLKREMEYLGYRINVVTKQNRAKYLKSYKEVNGWKN